MLNVIQLKKSYFREKIFYKIPKISCFLHFIKLRTMKTSGDNLNMRQNFQ